MMKALSAEQFISQIYRESASVSLEDFPAWTLNLLRQVIDFDAAIWAVGHSSTRDFHTQTAIDVSTELFTTLKKYVDINPIFEKISQANGTAIDMREAINDEDFYQSLLYKKCFKPFSIERILSSIHLDDRSGVFNLLTLYRFDRDKPFSSQEKEIQNRLLYHLLSAASHRHLIALNESQESSTQNNYSAICDSEGIYHSVSPRFLDILETQTHQETKHKFPYSIDIGCSEFTEGKLQFDITQHGDLFRLTVRVKNLFDKLTDREKQVVLSICQGNTFKQAARLLDLAPSTVSNHLYKIYTKLGIHNRSELIEMANSLQFTHPNT